MKQLTKKNAGFITARKWLLFAFIVFFGYIVSYFLLARLWISNTHLMHAAFELFGIIMMFISFMYAWNNYSETTSLIQWTGFGTLIILCINLIQIVNISNFVNVHEGAAGSLMDISTKYGVLTAYCEAVVWALICLPGKGFRIKRWQGLIIVLSVIVLFYWRINHIVQRIPVFYTGMNTTVCRKCTEIILALLTLHLIVAYYVKCKNNKEEREICICRCLIPALMFFILARICFSISDDFLSPVYLLGHIFRGAYYYCIYYGLYKATIEYPYMQAKRTKDFYRQLLDASRFGTIAFDTEGRISYISKQCDTFFDCDMKQFYGVTIEQFLDSIEIFEESSLEILEKIRRSNEEAVSFCGKPGSKYGKSGKLIFSIFRLDIGVVIAVEDAKKAQAIDSMHLQTQTLLDASDNVIFILDKNKKVVTCNKKFLDTVNCSRSEVVGIHVEELVNLVSESLAHKSHESIEFENIPQSSIWSVRTRKGDIRKIDITSSPVYDLDNEKIGWIAAGKDITEYEKEKEKLIHSEKMAAVGQMAAELVHEIKNPLASIKGLCQLMRSKINPEKIKEYAIVMERAVDDLREIIDGFLQFSRLTTGDFTKVGINSLVKSLEMMITTNAHKRGVNVYYHYSDVDRLVLISSQHIKNAILGIVDNALDAMSDAIDPKLIISTDYDKTANAVTISIKDNGIGMTEEQLSYVGTPFYTTKPKGTGLGVSVIKSIVSEHGGFLKIESKFGEGSKFMIVLPAIESA